MAASQGLLVVPTSWLSKAGIPDQIGLCRLQAAARALQERPYLITVIIGGAFSDTSLADIYLEYFRKSFSLKPRCILHAFPGSSSTAWDFATSSDRFHYVLGLRNKIAEETVAIIVTRENHFRRARHSLGAVAPFHRIEHLESGEPNNYHPLQEWVSERITARDPLWRSPAGFLLGAVRHWCFQRNIQRVLQSA